MRVIRQNRKKSQMKPETVMMYQQVMTMPKGEVKEMKLSRGEVVPAIPGL
jgi:hypothetical protein